MIVLYNINKNELNKMNNINKEKRSKINTIIRLEWGKFISDSSG